MKILLLILYLIAPIITFGQIPVITSNTTRVDKLKSEILKKFSNEYEFIFSYTTESWLKRKQQNYSILAMKKSKWYIISYNILYGLDSFGSRDISKINKTKIVKKKIAELKVKNLFCILDSQRFWNLNTDSLNITSRIYYKDKNDLPSAISFSTSEETLYKFEIITNDNYRIVSAKNPEYYLVKLPEIQVRQNFITCKNAFMNILK